MPFKRCYFEQVIARSERLGKFDELETRALEQRELRYEEWRAWKSDLISSSNILRLKYKPKNSVVPTDNGMAAAYNLAGQSRIPI